MADPWREVVNIGDATLYLGDAYEVIPALRSSFVRRETVCAMDPQYEFPASGGGKLRKSRKYMDEIEDAGLAEGFDIRIIDGPDDATWCASAFVFFHNDQGPDIWPALSDRFERTALCAWRKKNPMPVANKHYMANLELYLHAWDGDHHPRGELKDKKRSFDGAVGKSDFDHPTVKPFALMKKIMINAAPGLIVDPFMGSGSTGVAALAAGRRFIGVEINERWFKIACKRLQWSLEPTKYEMPGKDDPAITGEQVSLNLGSNA